MAHIHIVGAGVVGRATGAGFAKKGHCVTYIDVDPRTIARLRADGLSAMRAHEAGWSEAEIIMRTVSTPTVGGRIVLDHLESAAHDVGRGLALAGDGYPVVVVRSTVPPYTSTVRARSSISIGAGISPMATASVSSGSVNASVSRGSRVRSRRRCRAAGPARSEPR